MTSKELQSMLHAEPFEPFVLCSDGGDFRVPHPDLVSHDPGSTSASVTLADGIVLLVDLAAVYPLTDAELARQDADDLAAARDAKGEIEREGTIPWERVKAELGL